ncbi:iron-sulfur cluster biosynthesis family protein [Enterococcus faecalis]|uniref:iron-sulfur cluster biosynthesis family protein n=1 Tax=Enterococcus faecalis TaxID=1351 RepID=UPI0034CECCD5
MEIKITPKAINALRKRLRTPIFILALDDGSNQFSTRGGACSVGDSFQIIDIDEEVENYNIMLENPDFTVYISKNEKYFLGDNIAIDFNESMSTLILKNSSGILDSNLLVKEIN